LYCICYNGGVKYVRTILYYALFAVALTPAIYADSTVTPAQNIKTLFFRGLMFVVSVLFAYLLAFQKSFREEIAVNLKLLWKNPIFKMMAVLYGILILSTIFSYHPYIGFFGEPEREEGFLGLTFFYSFFLFATLLFKRKDWYTFFWVSMASQVVTFFVAMYQFTHGLNRTNSVLGNPIYFAVYALCLLAMSSLAWLRCNKERNGYAWLAAIFIGIAGIEIFLGNTRSVLLGVAVAFPIAVAYALRHTETIFPKISKKKVYRTTGILCSIVIIFAALFFSTRTAKIWTHIPGLDRISASTVGDATTRSRIVSWSIALHSINPAEAGVVRTLVGYGWDNYIYAWQKHYQPALYQYDTATFDHPHNKLLDMLVMNGALGFLAYMALWYFFIRAVRAYGKKDPASALVLLFWAVAFFVQNLFAFDSISSWILSFAIFGFIIHETEYLHEK
jgi:O-antigen ligase